MSIRSIVLLVILAAIAVFIFRSAKDGAKWTRLALAWTLVAVAVYFVLVLAVGFYVEYRVGEDHPAIVLLAFLLAIATGFLPVLAVARRIRRRYGASRGPQG